MVRGIFVFILIFAQVTALANPGVSNGRFDQNLLAAIGQELSIAHQRLEILNTLMQEDFEEKWLRQDFDAIHHQGHYDYSFSNRIAGGSIHSNDPYLKYRYMVARFGLNRAIDSLATWLMVDGTENSLVDVLSKERPTMKAVYAPWLGKNVESLKPFSVIHQRYPGLAEKISRLARVVHNANTSLHRQLMAESLILPAVQLALTKAAKDKLENDRQQAEKQVLSSSRVYSIAYKMQKEYLLKAFDEKLHAISLKYSCSRVPHPKVSFVGEEVVEEVELKASLTAEEETRLDQKNFDSRIAKVSSCVLNSEQQDYERDLIYLLKIRDDYIPKANETIFAQRKVYEEAKNRLQKINEDLMKLHITYAQLLNTEPYFMVLLVPVSRGADFKTELLYERIFEDHRILESLSGDERKDKLKQILAYIDSVLLQERPKAIERTLGFISTLSSGDASVLAPLVELRQQALQEIGRWNEDAVDLYIEQDGKIRDEFGFDLQFEKFADLTYFELYQLFAISLLSGQTKIASMKAMNAITAYDHFKQAKIKDIALLEKQKDKLLERLKKLDKSKANAFERKLIKNNIWRIEWQVLARSRAKAWGLGILAPAAPAWIAALGIDAAAIGVNYFKNKEYRRFARKVITDASAIGIVSYAANVHSQNFNDKDLLYTVAIQAATAFTFTNYSFFRGNNAGKMLHDFIHPSGSTSFNMLVHATTKASLQSLAAIAKSPYNLAKGIPSLFKNFGENGLRQFFGDKVSRPIINVLGSLLVATVIDMKLRGYSNPVTMFAEDEGFRINFVSFAIIDFLLSYVSEGNSVTKATMVNFVVSVLGVGLTQYLVKGENWKDFDVQRLAFEGAYIATYSTAKYRLFFKKSVIYFDNYWNTMFAHLAKAGNRQTARKLTSAAKFFINVGVFASASNLAGNAPFLVMVKDLEEAPPEPEGRERFYAEKAYDYILQVEKKNPRVKYSPEDLKDYLNYIRQINEELKRDIENVQG